MEIGWRNVGLLTLTETEMPSTKQIVVTGLIALAAVALVTFVQRQVMPIPVVGALLPR